MPFIWFAGLIGGLLAIGLVGILAGPVMLAVGYTLLKAWMGEIEVLPDPPSDRGEGD